MQNLFDNLTPEQARLLRSALLSHDGGTLAPHWGREQQRYLTGALDRLRLVLWDIYEPEE